MLQRLDGTLCIACLKHFERESLRTRGASIGVDVGEGENEKKVRSYGRGEWKGRLRIGGMVS